jgi:hypothetical protein
MKTIGQHITAPRDASGAHQSTCNSRRWHDHRMQVSPSDHLARIIEIIWQLCCLIDGGKYKIFDFPEVLAFKKIIVFD